ncbi:MAG: hypothetical protein IJ661_00400 [Lachnospiraceae bacterium]|nr:hypothetical protein [Lachnospiraceae bacterium]
MPENSNEPMGLRANGAFSLWSFCVENHEKIIKNYLEVAPYLCEMIAEVDRRLCTKVDELGDDLKNFINHADMAEKTGMYDKALGEMLLYIKCKQYDKALDLATVQIEAGNFGSFKNEGKYIYEHVAEYCKEHTRG